MDAWVWADGREQLEQFVLCSMAHKLFKSLIFYAFKVISSGFVRATSNWSRLFFIANHIGCVTIALKYDFKFFGSIFAKLFWFLYSFSSILTAFILELFWLEQKTGEISVFETNLEQRMKKFGLLAKNDLTNQHADSKPKNKIVQYFYSFILRISKEYDNHQPINYLSIQNIKFFIDFQAPVSIEILLQKYFSDEFEITNL